uniref:Uncharacterized protein n=1 Tax=Magallana gigas TaxID=29159 RepID=A0A8W8MNK4_MAGGI
MLTLAKLKASKGNKPYSQTLKHGHEDKKANLAEGTSVIVMHYIHITEPTEGIIITKNTKVMKTSDVEVPTEIQRQGALIANPTC